jgi:hypothetical protein
MKEKIFTRRDFLRSAAGTVVAAALAPGLLREAQAEPAAKVVLIRHRDVLDQDGKIQPEALKEMVDEAVATLVSEKEPLPAWRKLFQPSDVVGIKSNSWRDMPTPNELEAVLKGRLVDVGIPEKDIAIADRGVGTNPAFLKATALLNVRPARTHHYAGMGSCIKNYIQFVPRPSDYHPDACADLAQIWSLPAVKGKTRLNILCVLMPQFYGRGTHLDKRYLWSYRGLIVGTDPVAVDTVGAHLLQVKRIAFFGEDRAMDVPPTHIIVADKKYHLGVSDLSRIQVIKLGWMEEVLI